MRVVELAIKGCRVDVADHLIGTAQEEEEAENCSNLQQKLQKKKVEMAHTCMWRQESLTVTEGIISSASDSKTVASPLSNQTRKYKTAKF